MLVSHGTGPQGEGGQCGPAKSGTGSVGAGAVYVSSVDCWEGGGEASAGPAPSTPFPTGDWRHGFSLQPL